MRNALTVDLEDWYHPELVRHRLLASRPAGLLASRSAGPSAGERVTQIEKSTAVLLDLLREQGIKATFFVVGEVAERHPQLIQAIAAQGHELACHGMSHRPLWQMTSDEFRTELRSFSATMQAIVPDVEIIGFRAPTFSLDNRTRWALDVLAEFGYHYDSSIFPLKNPVYGVNGCPLAPYRPSADDVSIADAGRPLVEFPMSVWNWAGLRVPVCGGFYLRVLPFRLIQFCLRHINQLRPFAIYVHPWEMYPQTPRLALPIVARFITYYNLGAMRGRLNTLLSAFSFAPMRAVLEQVGV